jgi:hypothetical protein
MDASRPLLAGDAVEDEEVNVRSPDCLSRYLSANGLANGRAQSNGHSGNGHAHYLDGSEDEDEKEDARPLCCRPCSRWPCWKWVFPDRIGDYEDFATSAQMGEVYALRQAAREQFDPTLPGTASSFDGGWVLSNDGAEDDDMLQHLWSGLFPTLPYEGRVNARWRDVGFQVRLLVCLQWPCPYLRRWCCASKQNDDPVSDLRTSGRLAVRMLLYFSDHLNDEFKVGRSLRRRWGGSHLAHTCPC